MLQDSKTLEHRLVPGFLKRPYLLPAECAEAHKTTHTENHWPQAPKPNLRARPRRHPERGEDYKKTTRDENQDGKNIIITDKGEITMA